MRRFVVALVVIGVVLLGACTPPATLPRVETPPTTPTPPPIPREEVFVKVMERVVSLAQTPEAKEYVSIFFPPHATTSEYYEELRAWATTITTLRPDTCERMESFDWCLVDCEEYLEAFNGDRWSGYWLVYNDGRILPVGWALIIEADIERLNTNRTLTTPEPATISSVYITSSDITKEPLRYDGRGIMICGQTYLEGSEPRLLVDGKSGIRITGNTAGLQKGFYCLIGKYDADTNALNVTQFDERQAEYLMIETGKRLDIDLVRVSVVGLTQ